MGYYDYDDSMMALEEAYEAEREWRMEAALEEDRIAEANAAFEAQQADPRRAICLPDEMGDCLVPSVWDREDEIPF